MSQLASDDKRRLSMVERRALQAADIANFVRDYGRRAQKGVESNDRRYDKGLQRRLRRMDPQKLDALLRDDED